MALTVCVWIWGSKYGSEYVTRLREGVKRHLKQDYRFVIVRPSMKDEYLTKIPGCFCRLRMFDPRWQAEHQIKEGDRVVCMDLDSVVTGSLDLLFDREEPFVILQGANASNPNPMNGSLWMLRAGYRPDVWADFSLQAAAHIKSFEFPDDQGWFWDRMPDAAGWKAGPESGVYAFQKPGWPKGDDLPEDARLVVFPGWRDPSKFAHLKWVADNWEAA